METSSCEKLAGPSGQTLTWPNFDMGVIVDANVASEVFSGNRTSAGDRFRQHITTGDGFLSSGGKNLAELRKLGAFREWEKTAVRFERLRYEETRAVKQRTDVLVATDACESDDEHVIALANIGCGRLLFTNDRALQRDFRNRDLVNDPRGQVFTTLRSQQFTEVHRGLLNRRNLCASGRCNSA